MDNAGSISSTVWRFKVPPRRSGVSNSQVLQKACPVESPRNSIHTRSVTVSCSLLVVQPHLSARHPPKHLKPVENAGQEQSLKTLKRDIADVVPGLRA